MVFIFGELYNPLTEVGIKYNKLYFQLGLISDRKWEK